MCLGNAVALKQQNDQQSSGRTVFTFGGGAWFHAFYFGVGAAIADFSLDRADASMRVCGVSAGALVAASLAFEKDLHEVFDLSLEEAFPKSGRNPLRAVECAVESIRKIIPPDEECRRISTRKRLLVGVSRHHRVFRLSARNVYDFCDYETTVAVLSASIHLPLLGGVRGVLLDGQRYFDGQLTQNWSCLPMYDDIDEEEDCVVRVTAYHDVEFAELRRGWITPRIELPKAWQLLPHSMDALRLLWRLGYLRMIEYLLLAEDASRLAGHFSMPCPSKWSNIEEQIDDTIRNITEKSKEGMLCTPCPHRHR